jgi:hypothetical protein
VVDDAVAFARRVGFEPDERQAAVLRSTAKQGILNCTRQWGKSTTAAAMALYRAWSRPEALVVVVSPSEKQSAELVRKARVMAARLRVKAKKDGIHKISMALPNGSRIVGMPGNAVTVRGLSAVSLLLIDEASRVTEEMYGAVRPSLAVSGGDLWLMSTPWSTRGFFYEAWEHGGPDWERVRVQATECPRIAPAWLEQERRQLGSPRFGREYMTEFMQDEAAAFEQELVEAALDEHVGAIDSGIAEFMRRRK